MLTLVPGRASREAKGGRVLSYSKTCHMGSCLTEPWAVPEAGNLALKLNELLKSDQLQASLQEAVIASQSLQNLKGNYFHFQGFC